MLQRISNKLRGSSDTRALVPVETASPVRQVSGTILYTHGDDVYTPAAYRANFGYTIARALGGQASIDDYTLGRALGVSAVAYACTEYAANTMSQLPIVIRDPGGDVLTGTPFVHFQRQAPRLLALSNRSLDIWGRDYLWKRPNPYGWKTGLEFINPQRIRELNTAHMRIDGYEIRDEWGYLLEAHAPADDVIVIEAFDPEPTGTGLSKFEVAWIHMGIELGLAQHAAAFFTNSARIDGMLTFSRGLTADEEKLAVAQWKEFKGAKNAHSTAVMPAGATWTAVQAVPKDLAMAELSADDIRKIVAIWGMHPALVGLGDAADPLSANSTYSALEINYIRNTVLPRSENLILAALNEQWAWRDFDRTDYYTIAVDEAAIPQLAEAQLAKSDTSIALSGAGVIDLDEARRMTGYPERQEGEYLKRKPDDALALWDASAISLGELRQLVGLKPLEAIENLFNVNGVGVVPMAELPTLWRNKLLIAPSVYNSEIITGEPLPQPVDPNSVVPTDAGGLPVSDGAMPLNPDGTMNSGLPNTVPDETRAGASVCIALDLANHPDLVALQRRVQQLYANEQVTWNASDKFHVTLLYAPAVEDAHIEALVAELQRIRFDEPGGLLPELDLRVGSLKSFDNVGEHALHFRIRQNAALSELQELVYDVVTGMGIQTSAYSVPGSYTPHITIGYAAIKPRAITFNSNLKVHPNGLLVWKEDETVYSTAEEKSAPETAPVKPDKLSQHSRKQCMECDAPPTKDVKWANGHGRAWFCDKHFTEWSTNGDGQGDIDYVHDIEGGEVPVDFSDGRQRSNRSLAPLQAAVDFTDNQFVKYARRTLSEALTAQGILDAEWVAPVDWRLVLAEVSAWTPNDVARFLRSVDLNEARKLDLPTTGWQLDGNTLYLTLAPNDGLSALRASLALELEGADLAPAAGWISGIAVARLTNPEALQLDALPEASYPLVGANVTLLRGDTVQQKWDLRGVAAGQLAELKRWQSMIRRKGREYAFENEHLPPQVESYIRMSLEDSASEDEVFEAARVMLARSYRDTRSGYAKAVTDILLKALSDEGSRRTLGATMRSTARRFGLQAASDALDDAGKPNESLSKDDVVVFRKWQDETSGYVTNLGEEIFKEPGGLTEVGVSSRAQMWCDKSLDTLYYAILRQNAPEKRGTWRVDPAKEHCENEGATFGCVERNNETRTMDEWAELGFPRDSRLTCGGFKCGCEIVDDETGKVLRSR